MPVISPVLSSVAPPDGVPVITWSGIAPGDTCDPFVVKGQRGLAMSVQISGTFGGATIAMQHSNDSTTYATLADLFGVAVSTTVGNVFEASSSAVYIRPIITGGTGSSVVARLVLRG